MPTEPTFPNLPKLSKLLDTLSELGCFNPHDGAGYELVKLRRYRDALFAGAPFKAGDRIELTKDYEIEKGSGWRGYEEMMSTGATAEVLEGDWSALEIWHPEKKGSGEGYFSICVRFDREWSVSDFGSERRVFENEGDDRHLFWFGRPEKCWRRVEAVSGSCEACGAITTAKTAAGGDGE